MNFSWCWDSVISYINQRLLGTIIQTKWTFLSPCFLSLCSILLRKFREARWQGKLVYVNIKQILSLSFLYLDLGYQIEGLKFAFPYSHSSYLSLGCEIKEKNDRYFLEVKEGIGVNMRRKSSFSYNMKQDFLKSFGGLSLYL